ncbi:MAG: O-methyltransferase [Elusimicrobiales bacterium]|nr:O-methyltransferase [Elusimicrobiales bacterium]
MEKFYPEKLDEKTIEYFNKHITDGNNIKEIITKKINELGIKNISITEIDSNLISLITLINKPKKVLEIGCFLGYSAITIAKNMPEDGRIYAIEKNDQYTQIALDIIKEIGFSNKITVINEDAIDYLPKLSKISPFDMCFIDADKENYPTYFKWSIKNIKSGGVIIAHNVFLKGKLFYDGDDKEQNKKSRGMREFLYNFFTEEKIMHRSIIPTPDGLAIAILK